MDENLNFVKRLFKIRIILIAQPRPAYRMSYPTAARTPVIFGGFLPENRNAETRR